MCPWMGSIVHYCNGGQCDAKAVDAGTDVG
jgi:hypothetical protein